MAEFDEFEDDIFAEIDKKIVMKYQKDGNGKASRTFVFGVHDFIPSGIVEDYMTGLKRKLGTNLVKATDSTNNKIVYKYNGDHQETIKGYLLKDYPLIQETDIEISKQ